MLAGCNVNIYKSVTLLHSFSLHSGCSLSAVWKLRCMHVAMLACWNVWCHLANNWGQQSLLCSLWQFACPCNASHDQPTFSLLCSAGSGTQHADVYAVLWNRRHIDLQAEMHSKSNQEGTCRCNSTAWAVLCTKHQPCIWSLLAHTRQY